MAEFKNKEEYDRWKAQKVEETENKRMHGSSPKRSSNGRIAIVLLVVGLFIGIGGTMIFMGTLSPDTRSQLPQNNLKSDSGVAQGNVKTESGKQSPSQTAAARTTTKPETPEELNKRIQNEFIAVAKAKMEQLKSYYAGLDKRICSEVTDTVSPKPFYRATYYEIEDNFSYDIRKTDSIVTPYVAVLNTHHVFFTKIADTEEGCNAKPFKQSSLGANAAPDTYNYAYQDGHWILESATP